MLFYLDILIRKFKLTFSKLPLRWLFYQDEAMSNIAELVVKIWLDADQFATEQQNVLQQVDRMAQRFPYLQFKSYAYTKELN